MVETLPVVPRPLVDQDGLTDPFTPAPLGEDREYRGRKGLRRLPLVNGDSFGVPYLNRQTQEFPPPLVSPSTQVYSKILFGNKLRCPLSGKTPGPRVDPQPPIFLLEHRSFSL